MTAYAALTNNLSGAFTPSGVRFAPLVISDRKRFCQEGWHIDRDGEGKAEYRGVVFNEMKGSLSDTDNLIERELAAMLFPDTSYGYNSGGDPEDIPELT